ncbi:MAG: trypsin-like peptidase domain-containing protein [Gemmatimonadales bacterium]|nr:trypsin-like peptidase domain-containing protein [Gemmatimonadales bacterium]
MSATPDWFNPTVAQQLLFNTIRIETRESAKGQTTGAGTGFLVSHGRSGQSDHVFLVTNKHVVVGAAAVVVFFSHKAPRGGPKLGSAFWVEVNSFGHAWYGHPDSNVDVAILRIDPVLDRLLRNKNEIPYLIKLQSTAIPTAEHLTQLDSYLPIIFLGYPSGLYDEKHFTPLIRQGTTASTPGLDFCGRPEFLIDAGVFPGSSGSPVFSFDLSIKGQIIDFRLLGLISKTLQQTELGELRFEEVPTILRPVVPIRQFLNLGVVVKATAIAETIDAYCRDNS